MKREPKFRKKPRKFDFSAWYFGQDIEDLFTNFLPSYLDTVNKLTENFAESLEHRFETVVRETVAMALEFIANDKDYSFFMFSTQKSELNPNGDPVIAFAFGDVDYSVVHKLSDFIEMCSDSNLTVIEKCILDERSKRK
jgi:hypothetical protein